jgi:ribosome maturation protein SDO1
MVSVEDAVIARLNKNNRRFEILVDCEKAVALRKGDAVDMRDVLASDMIFKDARKGEVAAGLKETFKTEDTHAIAKEIIKTGEVQLTAEYKRKLSEHKRKEVIDKIRMHATDPKTNLPIPAQRIELAMEQARVHIDPFKPADEQMKIVIDALRPILPIKTEDIIIELVFPARYAGGAYGVVHRFGEIVKDMWLNDGSWMVHVKVPAGLQGEFYDDINKFTHGDVRVKTR